MAEPTEKAAAAPPKRDKFASMAAAAAAPPKRDKLASMAAAAAATTLQQRGRDKFASMAAAASSASSAQQESNIESKEEAQEALKRRMAQRNQVLEDLQKAEGWTWQLVSLASKTCKSLQDLPEMSKDDISTISKQYQTTLKKIHDTLTPHAPLVVAYQNHGVDKRTEKEENRKADTAEASRKQEGINMYAARVEMRLAQERRSVLNELLRLEREEEGVTACATEPKEATAVGDKRKRQS